MFDDFDPTEFFHLAEAIAHLLGAVFNFFVELLKNKRAKRETEAAKQEREREQAKKEEQEREARQKERERETQQEVREREAKQQERERETQQQEQERETQQEVREREARQREQERKARQQERERDAKEEQERLQKQEREAQQQAREREAKKDQKNQAKLEFEQLFNEKFKLIDDKLETEKRDRMENERNLTRKIESLTQSMEYAIKLFQYLQLRHHSSSERQTLEYQERLKILAHFQLPEDSDEVLQNMFRASYIENPRHSLDTAQSSKDPNGARNTGDELIRLAMTTTTKGQNNAQDDITILDLHSQLFDDFEDDIASSEMRQMFNAAAEADEARERGNKLFNDQKFEEAIIWYTVSINKSPTAVAYSNKAEAYLNLNKLMEAENDCTNALKIDNQCFKAYARRAIARSKLGYNLKGALEDVEAALNLEPTNQKMKELRAKLNQLLG